MGPQSQRRNSLQERTHQLSGQAGNNGKKRKAGQCTPFGEEAFDPPKHCEVCKAKLCGRSVHRAHHRLCTNNGRTKGVTSTVQLAQAKISQQLRKHFNTPLTQQERGSWQNSTKEAGEAFFAPRPKKNSSNHPTSTVVGKDPPTMVASVTPDKLCAGVSAKMKDPVFTQEFQQSRAPLATLALAKLVVENIIRGAKHKRNEFFDGLTMTVPGSPNMCDNPHYHSIVGQKPLLVEWQKAFALDIPCPRINCDGALANDRTNFSKNKLLFPIFGLEGAPSWCMVHGAVCAAWLLPCSLQCQQWSSIE